MINKTALAVYAAPHWHGGIYLQSNKDKQKTTYVHKFIIHLYGVIKI